MRSSQIKCLACAFSAFFPPKRKRNKDDDGDGGNDSENEEDYYEVLGVPRKATPEEIRRAYKKKSLELHPDKIAQKRSKALSSSEYEACHAKFQRMKEASDCLSDPSSRDLYDALGPEWYDFVQDPSGNLDPSTLFDNLGQSNCCDRTKVLFIVLFVVGLIMLQPILICLKTDSILNADGGFFEDTDWYLLLIPLWVLNVIVSLVLVLFKRWAWFMQLQCLVVLEVFLALKFDDYIDWNYYFVLIPAYVFLVARIIDSVRWVYKVNEEIDRMITVPFLEKYVLNGEEETSDGFTAEDHSDGQVDVNGDPPPESNGERNVIRTIRRQHTLGAYIRYSDLTDEERDKINDVFVIVHIPPDSQAANDSDDDSQDETAENNIYTSPEYQQAASVREDCLTTIKQFVLAYIPTIVLVALRLDVSDNDWNWFLVFVPIWAMLGFRFMMAWFTICCASSASEKELIMRAHAAAKEAGRKREKTKYGSMELDTVEEGEEEERADEEKYSYDESEHDKVELIIEGGGRGGVRTFADNVSSPTYSTEFGSIDQMYSGEEDLNGSQDYEPQFELDEEAFRQAYEAEEEKAQSAAAESQSKAAGMCAVVMLQALLLTLFLIKLNEEYDDIDGDSYSAFWVFSPILILSGILLCCVCCAVYTVRDADTVDEMKAQMPSNEEAVYKHHDEDEQYHTEKPVSQSAAHDYYGGSILDDISDGGQEIQHHQYVADQPSPEDDVNPASPVNGDDMDDLD